MRYMWICLILSFMNMYKYMYMYIHVQHYILSLEESSPKYSGFIVNLCTSTSSRSCHTTSIRHAPSLRLTARDVTLMTSWPMQASYSSSWYWHWYSITPVNSPVARCQNAWMTSPSTVAFALPASKPGCSKIKQWAVGDHSASSVARFYMYLDATSV